MTELEIRVPVLACCGFSGSGKTTLLESLIPVIRARGISVAVIKHDAHGIRLDRPGKDSDRLFRAGADVLLRGSNETAARWHPENAPSLEQGLIQLGADHDLVLVEGHKQTALPKLWLLSEGEVEPPADVTGILEVLPWNADRLNVATDTIMSFLEKTWRERPVRSGVLVGGKSSRMGRPKQLLEHEGRTMVDRVVDAVGIRLDEPVLLGSGSLPATITHLRRVSDPPGIAGPLGGIVGALRWAPLSAWLLVACDQPSISGEAIDWLMDQRRPGRWAIMPRVADGKVEPFLAIYEPQALALLENLARSGTPGPWRIAEHAKVATPAPPPALIRAWRSINTPEDFEQLSP